MGAVMLGQGHVQTPGDHSQAGESYQHLPLGFNPSDCLHRDGASSSAHDTGTRLGQAATSAVILQQTRW